MVLYAVYTELTFVAFWVAGVGVGNVAAVPELVYFRYDTDWQIIKETVMLGEKNRVQIYAQYVFIEPELQVYSFAFGSIVCSG